MRNEIGSEFWNVPMCRLKNSLFTSKTKWFLSGRSALRYIIKDIKIRRNVHTVGLPSWCCDSIIIPFIDEGLEIIFYPVVVQNGVLKQYIQEIKADILLVMDYFGHSSDERFDLFEGIVIRDLTHSIFSDYQKDADYYFGSVRKWCGVISGGFAWCNGGFDNGIPIYDADRKYVDNRREAMRQKALYISGVSNQKSYLELFNEGEEFLDNLKTIQCENIEDIEMINYIDIDFIKERRLINSQVLEERLSDYTFMPAGKDGDCPLFVPILIDNRDKVRRFLINKGIYCPVHWPISKYHILSKDTLYIYDRELSLVCDQRYGVLDMERLSDLILEGISLC